MFFDVARPLLLLLWPVCGLLIFLMAKKWPSRTKKARVSHALRQVLIALLALCLAGVSVPGPAGQKAAWLLVDASASASGLNLDALARQALDNLEDGRLAGVIAFGNGAMVETPLSESPAFAGVQTAVDPNGSDLRQALLLAGALLPEDCDGGIAVISDGLVEGADAALLRNRGIPVNTLTAESAAGRDAQVTRVQATASAYEGQAFPVTVTVNSTGEGDARIVLYKNHAAAGSRDVTLRRGENTFVFQDTADHAGVMTYEAQVLLPGDAQPRNDRMGACVAVTGAPAVLIAEGKSGAGSELKKMLEAAGMTVETAAPGALPENAADYRAWHAVALVNVDADSLTEKQMAALDTAAKELGRGVAVFGGDQSYALGGYRGSPLETMLPVTIDVKNKMELPATALLLIIDKSGSMTAGQYGVTRLEVAKEAACRAAEVLTEQDSIGVIAFDDEGKWVQPMTKVTDIAAIQAQIGTIRPGGGTAFYTPLLMGLEALKAVSAPHKHVIFLTDGESGDQGYDQIVEEMRENGITLTAVAVGSGADVRTMMRLADLGGGRAYAAGEFDNVPKIFTKETMLISGTYVQNRVFTPVVTDESLTDFPGFPQLTGYLAASEKPLATVSLVSDREDPILAWWQYGAGRVLCWMSDVEGGWSEGFLNWSDASAFFGGLLSHVLPAREQAGEMTAEDGKITYTLPEEMTGTEYAVSARVAGPAGETLEIPLERTAASRYEAALDMDAPGAYAVEITVRQDGETVAGLAGGAVISYSREYDLREKDTGALQKLSADTGGRAAAAPEELLSFPETAARTRRSLTSALLTAALVILLLDIAQRRLPWEKTQVKPAEPRARAKKTKPEKPRPAAPAADPGKTSQELWEKMQKKKRL